MFNYLSTIPKVYSNDNLWILCYKGAIGSQRENTPQVVFFHLFLNREMITRKVLHLSRLCRTLLVTLKVTATPHKARVGSENCLHKEVYIFLGKRGDNFPQ